MEIINQNMINCCLPLVSALSLNKRRTGQWRICCFDCARFSVGRSGYIWSADYHKLSWCLLTININLHFDWIVFSFQSGKCICITHGARKV